MRLECPGDKKEMGQKTSSIEQRAINLPVMCTKHERLLVLKGIKSLLQFEGRYISRKW